MALNDGMFSSDRDDWETPDDLFAALNAEFRFTLDAAATAANAKVERFRAPPAAIADLYIREAEIRARMTEARLAGDPAVSSEMRAEARRIHKTLLANQRSYLASVEWDRSTWLNSPYGDELSMWMEACVRQSVRGCTVVALVPARLDTGWWVRSANEANERREIRGRLRFKGAPSCAPFPSAILVFRPQDCGVPRRLMVIDTAGRIERVLFGPPL